MSGSRFLTAISIPLLVLFIPAPLDAQSDVPDISLTVKAAPRRQVPIVIPPLQTDTGGRSDIRDAASVIRQIVTNDLTYSGVFNVLPPSLYSAVSATTGRLPLRQFSAIGADGVVFGTVACNCPPRSGRG